jgi:predicted deacylase
MKGSIKTAGVLMVAVIAFLAYVTPRYEARRHPQPIKSGPGVTAVKHLSDYFDGLKGTAGDTEVFVLDSGKAGGTILVLGGTHPNEPAGYLAATMLVENAKPTEGRLIVIPRANNSGFSHSDPMEGTPSYIYLKGKEGLRTFRFGSRATNSIDQWPDPDIYVHAGSGQTLAGSDTRNLNRAYPGRKDGNFSEQVAFAITQVVRDEKANITVDLHESSPEYPVINAMVAHEKAMDIAAEAVMNLQLDGIEMRLEPSPKNFHGLTHRELGDATDTLSILMETANPSQGRLRGKVSPESIVEGKDPLYVKAAKIGRLFVPFTDAGHPIEERVGRHIAGIMEFLKVYDQKRPQHIQLGNIPSYQDLQANGLGYYL